LDSDEHGSSAQIIEGPVAHQQDEDDCASVHAYLSAEPVVQDVPPQAAT
jgi:hypothetical protein